MARTTTLVGTIGAVGKDTSIKELRRVHAKGTLQNLIIDEITRVFVLKLHLFLVRILALIGDRTLITLLGDPCQTAVTIDMLPSTMKGLCNNQTHKTAMGWFLDKVLTSGMKPAECVEAMALLNRDQKSQRLRSIASELVTNAFALLSSGT